MTATALDSVIFCDIFSTPQMRGVFSDETRTGYCLDFEAALARAQARLGIIPEKAAREIVRQCRIENIDFARLKKQTERIGYPILGIVQQIVELCADGLGEWCHWGATTQDITDTVAVMQIRAALELVEQDMEAIATALADLSRRYRDTPMAGRSNLQQAVPLTFGFKMAALLEAAVADHERSTGPWEIEWISLPEIFLLASGALGQTKLILPGLEVDAERMRANLDLTRGMIVSEAVMMGLAPHLGRQRAHDLVYDICRKVAASGEPLVDLLAQDADISRHLTRAQIEKMCDPGAYLGLAGEMVDKVLARESRGKS